MMVLLIELAAADFQNDLRASHGYSDLCRRFAGPASATASPPLPRSLSGLSFFHRAFRFGSGLGAQLGFVQFIVARFCFPGRRSEGRLESRSRWARWYRVHRKFQDRSSQAHFGHARGIAVARAGEDDVFHARAAQSLGRLLAEHPGDRVGDIRFAAAVGADDGGDAFAVKFQLGAIAERFESQNLQLLEFEQSDSFVGGHLQSADPVCAGWSALQIAWNRKVNLLLTSRGSSLVASPNAVPNPRTPPMLSTNSNGEYGDGSSNKTPHIVGSRRTAFSCTHTAAITSKFLVGDKEAGDRESN